ncbi:MAG TPA: alpha/beta hydrolase [Gaiellaceae bacterium]|nr:alpha/beta hydrolase [Gaiellaceae bacterium]
MRPRERSVEVADAKLLLHEWEADGPPILFWHALGDHSSLQMIEAAPVLARFFGYRVIGVDAPGFGGSGRLPDEAYRMPALVDLAGELVDALEVDRPVWSGSSWGATIGVHFAAAQAERLSALVLLDGGYLHTTEGKSLDELKEHWRGQEGFRYASWDVLFAEAGEYFGRWSPELEEYARASFREEDGAVVSIMGSDVYAAAIHGVEQAPPWSSLEEIGKSGLPVLLLAAEKVPADLEERRAAGLERFGQLVRQADVRVVPGAPHFVLESRPGEAARMMGGWLQALPYA